MGHIVIENLGKAFDNHHRNGRMSSGGNGVQIVLKNIRKVFVEKRHQKRTPHDGDFMKKNVVLEGINLKILDGELVCILGPSGCGKSTLVNLIAGFDTDYSGNIFANGKRVTAPSSDNIFVFQHNGLLPWMTVRQNVELGIRHMESGEEKEEIVRDVIEMVELDGFDDHYPHQLSGGMQRRAELARALAVSPEMLIMDEPFSGLDFLTHMKMREEVVNMHQLFRKTTIIVTHNIDDALIMSDRVVILSDRPATVKMDRRLDYEHPRDPATQPGLHELREEIFFMLGVSYAV